MVMVQSALGGAACVTSPLLLASTVHSALVPPGPPVMVKWKTPPTYRVVVHTRLRCVPVWVHLCTYISGKVHQWEGRPSVCRAYAVLAPCWRPSGALTDTQHRLLGCLDLGPQSTTRRNPAGLVRLRLPGRAPPYDECGGDGPTDWRALDRH